MTLKGFNKYLRVTAALTNIFFIWNTLAWGQTSLEMNFRVDAKILESSAPAPISFSVPKELGQINEIKPSLVTPSPEHPFLIHIQDAHANYTAGQNIAKILEHLKREQGIKLVFVEGAYGKLDAQYLKFSANPALNNKIADRLAQIGELTPADVYLLKDATGLEFVGIEDPDLYRKDIEYLREVFRHEKESRDQIRSDESNLDRDISRLANKDLLTILRIYLHLDQKESSFAKVLSSLDQLSLRHLKRDLREAKEQKEFPNLMRLLRLKDEEGKVDEVKVEEEIKEIEKMVSLSSRPPSRDPGSFTTTLDSRLRGNDKSINPRYFLENLYAELKPYGFNFTKYPNFSKYAKHQIYEYELRSKELLEEINRWIELLLTQLAQTDSEKSAVERIKNFKLMSKLLLLELTRKEWEQIKTPDSRLQTPEKKTGVWGLGSIVSDAFEFYRLAISREQAFFDTIQKTLKEKKQSRAVVITGGFHANALQEYFTKNHAGYGIVSPHIEGEARSNYVKNMLGRQPEDIEISQAAEAAYAEPSAILQRLGVSVENRMALRNRIAASLGQGGTEVVIPFEYREEYGRFNWMIAGHVVNLVDAVADGTFESGWLEKYSPPIPPELEEAKPLMKKPGYLKLDNVLALIETAPGRKLTRQNLEDLVKAKSIQVDPAGRLFMKDVERFRNTLSFGETMNILRVSHPTLECLVRKRSIKKNTEEWYLPLRWVKKRWLVKNRLISPKLLAAVFSQRQFKIGDRSLIFHAANPLRAFGANAAARELKDPTKNLLTKSSNGGKVDIVKASLLVKLLLEKKKKLKEWKTAGYLAKKVGVTESVILGAINRGEVQAEVITPFSGRKPQYFLSPFETTRVEKTFENVIHAYKAQIAQFEDPKAVEERIKTWADLEAFVAHWPRADALREKWGYASSTSVEQLAKGKSKRLYGFPLTTPFAKEGDWIFPPQEMERLDQENKAHLAELIQFANQNSPDLLKPITTQEELLEHIKDWPNVNYLATRSQSHPSLISRYFKQGVIPGKKVTLLGGTKVRGWKTSPQIAEAWLKSLNVDPQKFTPPAEPTGASLGDWQDAIPVVPVKVAIEGLKSAPLNLDTQASSLEQLFTALTFLFPTLKRGVYRPRIIREGKSPLQLGPEQARWLHIPLKPGDRVEFKAERIDAIEKWIRRQPYYREMQWDFELGRTKGIYSEEEVATATRTAPISYRDVLWLIHDCVGDVTGKSMLGLGASVGTIVELFKSEGAIAKGIELNPKFVHYAQTHGLQDEILKSDLLSIPAELKTEQFDVTYSNRWLDHLEKQAETVDGIYEEKPVTHEEAIRILQHVAQLTKPGGLSIHVTENSIPFTAAELYEAGFKVLSADLNGKILILQRRRPEEIALLPPNAASLGEGFIPRKILKDDEGLAQEALDAYFNLPIAVPQRLLQQIDKNLDQMNDLIKQIFGDDSGEVRIKYQDINRNLEPLLKEKRVELQILRDLWASLDDYLDLAEEIMALHEPPDEKLVQMIDQMSDDLISFENRLPTLLGLETRENRFAVVGLVNPEGDLYRIAPGYRVFAKVSDPDKTLFVPDKENLEELLHSDWRVMILPDGVPREEISVQLIQELLYDANSLGKQRVTFQVNPDRHFATIKIDFHIYSVRQRLMVFNIDSPKEQIEKLFGEYFRTLNVSAPKVKRYVLFVSDVYVGLGAEVDTSTNPKKPSSTFLLIPFEKHKAVSPALFQIAVKSVPVAGIWGAFPVYTAILKNVIPLYREVMKVGGDLHWVILDTGNKKYHLERPNFGKKFNPVTLKEFTVSISDSGKTVKAKSLGEIEDLYGKDLSDIMSVLIAAEQFFEGGEIDKAEEKLKIFEDLRKAKDAPLPAEALRLKGLIQAEKGDLKGALTAFDQAISEMKSLIAIQEEEKKRLKIEDIDGLLAAANLIENLKEFLEELSRTRKDFESRRGLSLGSPLKQAASLGLDTNAFTTAGEPIPVQELLLKTKSSQLWKFVKSRPQVMAPEKSSALLQQVNPRHEDKIVFYPGSGPDVRRPILATDANRFVLVDALITEKMGAAEFIPAIIADILLLAGEDTPIRLEKYAENKYKVSFEYEGRLREIVLYLKQHADSFWPVELERGLDIAFFHGYSADDSPPLALNILHHLKVGGFLMELAQARAGQFQGTYLGLDPDFLGLEFQDRERGVFVKRANPSPEAFQKSAGALMEQHLKREKLNFLWFILRLKSQKHYRTLRPEINPVSGQLAIYDYLNLDRVEWGVLKKYFEALPEDKRQEFRSRFDVLWNKYKMFISSKIYQTYFRELEAWVLRVRAKLEHYVFRGPLSVDQGAMLNVVSEPFPGYDFSREQDELDRLNELAEDVLAKTKEVFGNNIADEAQSLGGPAVRLPDGQGQGGQNKIKKYLAAFVNGKLDEWPAAMQTRLESLKHYRVYSDEDLEGLKDLIRKLLKGKAALTLEEQLRIGGFINLFDFLEFPREIRPIEDLIRYGENGAKHYQGYVWLERSVRRTPPFEEMDIQPGHAVLDIGAGPGEDSIPFAEHHPLAQIRAIDANSSNVRTIIEKLEGRNTPLNNLTLTYSDINKLEFADSSVDRILFSSFFYSTNVSFPEMMRLAFRVLKPKGRVVLNDDHLWDLHAPQAERIAREMGIRVRTRTGRTSEGYRVGVIEVLGKSGKEARSLGAELPRVQMKQAAKLRNFVQSIPYRFSRIKTEVILSINLLWIFESAALASAAWHEQDAARYVQLRAGFMFFFFGLSPIFLATMYFIAEGWFKKVRPEDIHIEQSVFEAETKRNGERGAKYKIYFIPKGKVILGDIPSDESFTAQHFYEGPVLLAHGDTFFGKVRLGGSRLDLEKVVQYLVEKHGIDRLLMLSCNPEEGKIPSIKTKDGLQNVHLIYTKGVSTSLVNLDPREDFKALYVKREGQAVRIPVEEGFAYAGTGYLGSRWVSTQGNLGELIVYAARKKSKANVEGRSLGQPDRQAGAKEVAFTNPDLFDPKVRKQIEDHFKTAKIYESLNRVTVERLAQPDGKPSSKIKVAFLMADARRFELETDLDNPTYLSDVRDQFKKKLEETRVPPASAPQSGFTRRRLIAAVLGVSALGVVVRELARSSSTKVPFVPTPLPVPAPTPSTIASVNTQVSPMGRAILDRYPVLIPPRITEAEKQGDDLKPEEMTAAIRQANHLVPVYSQHFYTADFEGTRSHLDGILTRLGSNRPMPSLVRLKEVGGGGSLKFPEDDFWVKHPELLTQFRSDNGGVIWMRFVLDQSQETELLRYFDDVPKPWIHPNEMIEENAAHGLIAFNQGVTNEYLKTWEDYAVKNGIPTFQEWSPLPSVLYHTRWDAYQVLAEQLFFFSDEILPLTYIRASLQNELAANLRRDYAVRRRLEGIFKNRVGRTVIMPRGSTHSSALEILRQGRNFSIDDRDVFMDQAGQAHRDLYAGYIHEEVLGESQEIIEKSFKAFLITMLTPKLAPKTTAPFVEAQKIVDTVRNKEGLLNWFRRVRQGHLEPNFIHQEKSRDRVWDSLVQDGYVDSRFATPGGRSLGFVELKKKGEQTIPRARLKNVRWAHDKTLVATGDEESSILDVSDEDILHLYLDDQKDLPTLIGIIQSGFRGKLFHSVNILRENVPALVRKEELAEDNWLLLNPLQVLFHDESGILFVYDEKENYLYGFDLFGQNSHSPAVFETQLIPKKPTQVVRLAEDSRNGDLLLVASEGEAKVLVHRFSVKFKESQNRGLEDIRRIYEAALAQHAFSEGRSPGNVFKRASLILPIQLEQLGKYEDVMMREFTRALLVYETNAFLEKAGIPNRIPEISLEPLIDAIAAELRSKNSTRERDIHYQGLIGAVRQTRNPEFQRVALAVIEEARAMAEGNADHEKGGSGFSLGQVDIRAREASMKARGDLKRGKPGEALDTLRDAIAIFTDDSVLWTQKATALLGLGGRENLELALESIHIAERINPFDAQTYSVMAQIYLNYGDAKSLEKAMDAVEHSIRLANEIVVQNYVIKIQILKKQKQFDEAFRLAKWAMEPTRWPKDPQFFGLKAGILAEMGNPDAAIGVMRKGLRINENDLKGWTILADLLRQRARLSTRTQEKGLSYHQSLEAVDRAIQLAEELGEDDEKLFLFKAEIHQEMGLARKGESILQIASRLRYGSSLGRESQETHEHAQSLGDDEIGEDGADEEGYISRGGKRIPSNVPKDYRERSDLSWSELSGRGNLWRDRDDIREARKLHVPEDERYIPGYGVSLLIFPSKENGFNEALYQKLLSELRETRAAKNGKIKFLPNPHHTLHSFVAGRAKPIESDQVNSYRRQVEFGARQSRPFQLLASGVGANRLRAKLQIEFIPDEGYLNVFKYFFGKAVQPPYIINMSFAAIIEMLNEEEQKELIALVNRWRGADFGLIHFRKVHLIHHGDHEADNRVGEWTSPLEGKSGNELLDRLHRSIDETMHLWREHQKSTSGLWATLGIQKAAGKFMDVLERESHRIGSIPDIQDIVEIAGSIEGFLRMTIDPVDMEHAGRKLSPDQQKILTDLIEKVETISRVAHEIIGRGPSLVPSEEGNSLGIREKLSKFQTFYFYRLIPWVWMRTGKVLGRILDFTPAYYLFRLPAFLLFRVISPYFKVFTRIFSEPFRIHNFGLTRGQISRRFEEYQAKERAKDEVRKKILEAQKIDIQIVPEHQAELVKALSEMSGTEVSREAVQDFVKALVINDQVPMISGNNIFVRFSEEFRFGKRLRGDHERNVRIDPFDRQVFFSNRLRFGIGEEAKRALWFRFYGMILQSLFDLKKFYLGGSFSYGETRMEDITIKVNGRDVNLWEHLVNQGFLASDMIEEFRAENKTLELSFQFRKDPKTGKGIFQPRWGDDTRFSVDREESSTEEPWKFLKQQLTSQRFKRMFQRERGFVAPEKDDKDEGKQILFWGHSHPLTHRIPEWAKKIHFHAGDIAAFLTRSFKGNVPGNIIVETLDPEKKYLVRIFRLKKDAVDWKKVEAPERVARPYFKEIEKDLARYFDEREVVIEVQPVAAEPQAASLGTKAEVAQAALQKAVNELYRLWANPKNRKHIDLIQKKLEAARQTVQPPLFETYESVLSELREPSGHVQSISAIDRMTFLLEQEVDMYHRLMTNNDASDQDREHPSVAFAITVLDHLLKISNLADEVAKIEYPRTEWEKLKTNKANANIEFRLATKRRTAFLQVPVGPAGSSERVIERFTLKDDRFTRNVSLDPRSGIIRFLTLSGRTYWIKADPKTGFHQSGFEEKGNGRGSKPIDGESLGKKKKTEPVTKEDKALLRGAVLGLLYEVQTQVPIVHLTEKVRVLPGLDYVTEDVLRAFVASDKVLSTQTRILHGSSLGLTVPGIRFSPDDENLLEVAIENYAQAGREFNSVLAVFSQVADRVLAPEDEAILGKLFDLLIGVKEAKAQTAIEVIPAQDLWRGFIKKTIRTRLPEFPVGVVVTEDVVLRKQSASDLLESLRPWDRVIVALKPETDEKLLAHFRKEALTKKIDVRTVIVTPTAMAQVLNQNLGKLANRYSVQLENDSISIPELKKKILRFKLEDNLLNPETLAQYGVRKETIFEFLRNFAKVDDPQALKILFQEAGIVEREGYQFVGIQVAQLLHTLTGKAQAAHLSQESA